MKEAIMVRRADGATTFVLLPSKKALLVGTPTEVHWEALSAASLPYTGEDSHLYPTMELLLESLLSRVETVGLTSSNQGLQLRAVRQDLDTLKSAFERFQSEIFKRINDLEAVVITKTHPGLQIDRASNPALKLNRLDQSIYLDLSTPGSFFDARSQLGVNSLQAAFEMISQKLTHLSHSGEALKAYQANLREDLVLMKDQLTDLHLSSITSE